MNSRQYRKYHAALFNDQRSLIAQCDALRQAIGEKHGVTPDASCFYLDKPKEKDIERLRADEATLRYLLSQDTNSEAVQALKNEKKRLYSFSRRHALAILALLAHTNQ